MAQEIIREVLANWLGEDYPGLDELAADLADSLRDGAPTP